MTRGILAEQDYWETYWRFKSGDYSARLVGKDSSAGPLGRVNFIDTVKAYAQENYHDYLFWNVVYKKFMPGGGKIKVLEIGSAPGYHLVRLNRVFGCVPYGVENSDRGVEINREVFRAHGIRPDNVIHEDFFSEKFQREYREYFDVIISRGFIEDFGDSDAAGVIEKHKNLLKPGGRLFAAIPNFKGINYIGLALFSRELLKEVNFNIMDMGNFRRIFDDKQWELLYCRYYGTFNCGDRFSPRKDIVMRSVLTLCNGVQKVLNVLFRVLLRDEGAETGIFSPYIVFVGAKR